MDLGVLIFPSTQLYFLPSHPLHKDFMLLRRARQLPTWRPLAPSCPDPSRCLAPATRTSGALGITRTLLLSLLYTALRELLLHLLLADSGPRDTPPARRLLGQRGSRFWVLYELRLRGLHYLQCSSVAVLKPSV